MFRIESGDVIQAAEQDARIAVFLAPDGKDIEEGGQTMLCTHVPFSGNQMVIESSASDGAGVNSHVSPATLTDMASVIVRVGATKPGVNGACSERSELPPKPHIDQAVRPVGVEEHAELLDEPRLAAALTSEVTRRRLPTIP